MWETIYTFISNHLELTLIGAVTLIQVAPIKIDPWLKVAGWIRSAIFGDIEKKIDKLSSKVDAVEKIMDAEKAGQARNHILRFADELYDGKHHSQEYFLQILDDIKTYESYCSSHPEFPNGRTVDACEKIRTTYDSLWKHHKF
jgi:hypothetical protein